MIKTITRQTIHSQDFKEKCLDEIHRKVKCNMVVFGTITANDMKVIIKESLLEYMELKK